MKLSYFLILLFLLSLSQSTDYSDDDEHDDNDNTTISRELESFNQPILKIIKDVEWLASFVLMRGHVIIDSHPKHKIRIDESRMEKLVDHLYDSLHRITLPATEDRDLGCENMQVKKQKELCHIVSSDCLSSNEMLELVPEAINFQQIIARLCPLILFRQTQPICSDDFLLNNKEEEPKLKLVEPSIERVWGFGVLFTTLSIVVSIGGLIVVPFLKRDARRIILTLFEGLAVGGLAGSAILHLFPQAFDIVDDKYRTYFWHISFIFLGMYVFYCFELALKISKTIRNRGKRKRTPSLRQEEDKDMVLSMPLINYKQQQQLKTTGSPETVNDAQDSKPSSSNSTITRSKRSNSLPVNQALLNSTREQLVQCLATVNVLNPAPSSSTHMLHEIQTININGPIKQTYVSGVALRRQDQNSTAATIPIDSVAWMIVLGDALLNFIDGLSIGAAFDRNILAGMSISVAVMLEEVTHRLGTFAVLIRAGMEMKQSFLYILLSACACYPGLVVGVVLGDAAEEASPYIFALAGGFFLYMALVDVMKEMTRSLDNALHKGIRNALPVVALQNLGIIIASIILAVLAYYEKEMDFEAVEIKELTENAIE